MVRPGENGPNKSTFRNRMRSALANKAAADSLLDTIAYTQGRLNAALVKLNADAAAFTAAVAATAVLDLTADITLTSTTAGASRNTNTLTLQVLAAAANPTNTILVSFTGTAAAIVVTVTPNNGTNNAATAVNLTTAQLRELITTGAVVGKTVTITDASSLRTKQTATGGGATNLADGGEGDGVVATFASGANAFATGLDTNYVATVGLATTFSADSDPSGDPYKVSMRKVMQSALAHRRLANELVDSLEEMQTAYTALLVKLNAESGTLNDKTYVSLLAVDVIPADDEGTDAQHKTSLRTSLRSAMANAALADKVMDAMVDMQESFNAALALLDTAAINGVTSALQVEVLDPDAEA